MSAATSTGHYLEKIDAYIGKSADFAQPILWHVRELFHKAVPELEEAVKWSMPFFTYKGIILGNMAAFKAHCAIGIWGQELVDQMKKDKAVPQVTGGSMGNFGRITSLKDLPADKVLIGYLKTAKKQIDEGTRTQSYARPAKPKTPKAEPEIPEVLAAALKKNKAAQQTFEAFPPSCRKEYIEWVSEAKREATRDARVAQAIAWMSEGKRRNWKYENC